MSEENGKAVQQNLTLQPLQLAALLVIDGILNAMQTGANQLGGFLKLKTEGDILVRSLQILGKEKEALMNDWARSIQVVQALPNGPVNGIIKGK